MSLAFNEQNWEQILNVTKTGASAGGDRYFAIPDFSSSIQFENGICAVTADSSSVPNHWRFAGWASLKVRSGLFGGGLPDTICKQHRILFNKTVLLQGPPVATDFALEFSIASWVPSLTLTAWAYIGPV
jgi:hypothetical protein